jgi:hypothetical protein
MASASESIDADPVAAGAAVAAVVILALYYTLRGRR